MIEHSYLYNHIGDPDVITSCNKILTHRHARSNRQTRLFLSTASLFASRLSGPEKPAVWFAQREGQFALSNITLDATKFYYVISQLDTKYAAKGDVSSPQFLKLLFLADLVHTGSTLQSREGFWEIETWVIRPRPSLRLHSSRELHAVMMQQNPNSGSNILSKKVYPSPI